MVVWGYRFAVVLTVTVSLEESKKLAAVSLASGRSILVKLEGKKEFSARTVLLSARIVKINKLLGSGFY